MKELPFSAVYSPSADLFVLRVARATPDSRLVASCSNAIPSFQTDDLAPSINFLLSSRYHF